jgi:hypothetical protein
MREEYDFRPLSNVRGPVAWHACCSQPMVRQFKGHIAKGRIAQHYIGMLEPRRDFFGEATMQKIDADMIGLGIPVTKHCNGTFVNIKKRQICGLPAAHRGSCKAPVTSPHVHNIGRRTARHFGDQSLAAIGVGKKLAKVQD